MVAKGSGTVLAIVQARGGSRSLPRKNLRPLGGHPLVAWSVAAGAHASSVDRVIVSTDDPEIAEIARRYGAEAPFLRPAELARDDSPDFPLVRHALEWLAANEGYRPDVVVQLRPTSPLRPAGLVDQAVAALLARGDADSARAVTTPAQNPHKMWRSGEDGFLRPLLEDGGPEPYNRPRQLLPPVWWQTGHADAIRVATIEAKGSLTGDRVVPVPVDSVYAVDIDTEDDWARAEWLIASGRVTVPAPGPPALPLEVGLLVLDFDGVLTDNRVWVAGDGAESVACSRSDGLALEALRGRGVPVVVLSREAGPVVAARCRKLGLPLRQGEKDKGTALRELAQEHGVELARVVYVGNDVNDLECLALAGCGVAVADAHAEVLRRADLVLTRSGGRGAVGELCDLVRARMEADDHA